MAENQISINFSNQGTQNEVRMRVINQFATEEAGTGREDLASRYTYYVETFENGNRVYLRRPANLYNGFDFLVCVEGYNFAGQGQRKRNFPKHEDIIADLKIKLEKEKDKYIKLLVLIEQVHDCKDVSEEKMRSLNFENGFSTEMILKTIKWLFIEQDIRYWNYSGRNMLWNALPRME